MAKVSDTLGQRDAMRELVKRHGRNEDAVCRAYAAAERAGRVARVSNTAGLSPERYAAALWADGIRKGWLR